MISGSCAARAPTPGARRTGPGALASTRRRLAASPRPGRPALTLPLCCACPQPTDAPPLWEFGAAAHRGAASQRPVTPAVGALGDGGSRQARQPAARAATAAPPASLKQPGFFRAAMRTTSDSLSGLLKRPGTAAPAPAAAGASPLFEVRGAAMLAPEPPAQLATVAPAASHGRSGVHPQQHKPAPPAYNVHARAAHSRPATATCASPPVAPSPQRQASPAAVASHGLDPSTSPAPQPAAATPHYQQPLRRPAAAVHATTNPTAASSAAAAAQQAAAQRQAAQEQQFQRQQQQTQAQGGTFSRASSLGSSAGSSSLPSSSGDYGSSSQGPAPPAVMHQNPLYTGGSESVSFGLSRQQAAQPQARPPPVRVAPPARALPATPPASMVAGTAGVSPSPTPTSNLQVRRLHLCNHGVCLSSAALVACHSVHVAHQCLPLSHCCRRPPT